MNSIQNQRKFFRLLLKIPVPWVFILGYLIGLIPQFLIPVNVYPQEIVMFVKITGAVLFIIGAVFAAWSLIIFRKYRTTTTPGEKSAKLVTWGPYRISRNPMYVSLTLAYIGESGLLAQAWPLLILPFVIIYVNFIVIPLEEDMLKTFYTDDYENYRKKVGRWL